MGGQDQGEQASGLAAEIIPRVSYDRLAAHDDPGQAVQKALSEANQAIVQAGRHQPAGRRMGTTAVLAVKQDVPMYVAGLGDRRAYFVCRDHSEQLTSEHSVAEAVRANGS